MGFQQELFEVDLERGEVTEKSTAASAFRAESAITYALVLLVAAAVAKPTQLLGLVLAVCSFGLSFGGAFVLARRSPPAPHAKKVLLTLVTCWLLYGVRLVHLTSANATGVHKPKVLSANAILPRAGVPRKLGHREPHSALNAVGMTATAAAGAAHGKKIGPVQRYAVRNRYRIHHSAHHDLLPEMPMDDAHGFDKA